MYRGLSVAVVMPVHNERAQIQQAIARVPSYVDRVLVIDDGSSDGTGRVLALIPDPRIEVITHQRNRGVGAATKTGYERALEIEADLISVMDGDGQMDGEDLFRLLDRAIAGVDYVKGNRFLNMISVRAMPRIRYVGNRVFSWLARRAALFEGALDSHCGYTVIQRHALARLPLGELYDRYGFPTEMFFAAGRANLKVDSVAVKTIYGDEVSGINPFTTIPTILFLIARSYVRIRCARRSSQQTFKPAAAEPARYHLEA
jgi:glycosyltransferase involved in cell wall biosynthesis